MHLHIYTHVFGALKRLLSRTVRAHCSSVSYIVFILSFPLTLTLTLILTKACLDLSQDWIESGVSENAVYTKLRGVKEGEMLGERKIKKFELKEEGDIYIYI